MLKNNDVINIDNNETLPIPNGTTLPDNQIASVHEKNCRKILTATTTKEIIMLTRSLLITQNQSSY